MSEIIHKNRPVYAVLLAAGESRRCRPKKLFLPWGRVTVLERSVSNLLDSGVEKTVVVLGHEPAPLQRLLINKDCLVVINREYRRGMASTFLAGIREIKSALSPPPDAGYLLALADAPFIDPDIVNRLVAAYRDEKADIVVPTYKEKRGHPSIFSGVFSSEIADSIDRGGMRELLRKYPERIHHLPVETEAVLEDIDTYADYKKQYDKYGVNTFAPGARTEK